MTVELDTSGMVAGDTAGLALLSSPYAWIGVVKSTEGATLQDVQQPQPRPPIWPPTPRSCPGQRARRQSDRSARASLAPRRLQLRQPSRFQLERQWQEVHAPGRSFRHDVSVHHIPGGSPRLFHYNRSGEPGGHVDFDNYTVDEPRARGIERRSLGKTIVLTSGADGSPWP